MEKSGLWSKIRKKLKLIQRTKPYKVLMNKLTRLCLIAIAVSGVLQVVFKYKIFLIIIIGIVSVFFIQFLGHMIRPKIWRILSISIIIVAVFTWVVVNGWKDIQKARGIQFPPAKSDEFLIIVAKFDQRGGIGLDPTTRIVERLRDELEKADIENTRIEIVYKICNMEEARRIGKIHNALFVIWGWYDDVGFNPMFTIIEQTKQPVISVKLKEIPSELQEFNVYIREGLPGQMTYLCTFIIGQLYHWQGNYEKALSAFDVSLKNLELSEQIGGNSFLDSKINFYFYRGLTYINSYHFDKAIIDYTKLIELDSIYARAYNNRGLAYAEDGNFDQAITDYTKTIELDPKSVVAYTNRGIAYAEKGNFGPAFANFTKAIELDPKYAAAYYNRGFAYAIKDSFDKAITDYTKTIELDPTLVEAYYNRALAYGEKDSLDQAIADFTKVIEFFTKAIEIDSIYVMAYFNRGVTYAKNGNFDLAISDFTQAIELNPIYAQAYFSRGAAYAEKGNFDQAITDYTEAIELDTTYVKAYFNRGFAYAKNGNFDQAIANFTRVIKLFAKTTEPDATYVQAYYNRGLAYVIKDSLDQAISDYTKAIELNPTYAKAYYSRGFAFAKKNRKAQAVEDFKMYLRLLPKASNRSVVLLLIQKLQK